MISIQTMTTLAVIFLVATSPLTDAVFCWKNTKTRGVGTLPGCSSNQDYDAGLCYQKCQSGYYGVGPVCWRECPSYLTDHGVSCFKPGPYWQSSYAWHWDDGFSSEGMRDRCYADYGWGNCYKSGAIYYPYCKGGYHSVGCCICSPDCPWDFTDSGVGCIKPIYGRGVGGIPSFCPDGKEYDAGLCYNECDEQQQGVGPVCWGYCRDDQEDCGAGCADTFSECADAVTGQILATIDVVNNIAEMVSTAGTTLAVATAAKTAAATTFGKLTGGITREAIVKTLKEAAEDAGETIAEAAIAETANLATGITPNWNNLDPTGIANVVKAFNQELCS